MTIKNLSLALFVATLSVSLSHSHAFADDMSGTAPAADNSKVNAGDQSAGAVTADQAKNTASDRDVMRKIRQSIVQDKSLSVYAHNVKIISVAGKVTLKGVVHTEEEKKTIGEKAAAVAGADNVTNTITVKGA